MKMKYAVSEIGSSTSKALVKEIEIREKILMKNEGLLLSIYFDPRYKTILTQSQVKSYFCFTMYTSSNANGKV